MGGSGRSGGSGAVESEGDTKGGWGWGGAFQPRCLQSYACDHGGSGGKRTQLCPAATARRGMFLGGLNLDPACCTINPD